MLSYWNASISVKGHTLTFQCSCSSQTIQTLAKWKGYNPEPGGKCSYETKVKLAKNAQSHSGFGVSAKKTDEEACFCEAKCPSHPWCGFISFCHCLPEEDWLLINAFVWYFWCLKSQPVPVNKETAFSPLCPLSEQWGLGATSKDGQRTLHLAITCPSSLL